MQNYQKKKFDKKKKNTENIFPYIIFSNISEKLMAENLLCAFRQHHTFAAKVGLSTLLALEEIRETLTCDSYKTVAKAPQLAVGMKATKCSLQR